MNCTNCGEVLSPGVNACPKCGTLLGQPVAPPVSEPVTEQVSVQQPVQQPVTQAMPQPVMSSTPEVQPVSPASEPVAQQQMMPTGMPQPAPIPMQQQPAPQPAVGGVVPSQQPVNGKPKIGLIILIVILVLALGVGGYLVYDNSQENKASEKAEDDLKKWEEEEKKEKEEKEKIQKQLKIKKETRLDDGTILFVVENTSSKTLSGNFEVEFYDASNKILGTREEYVTVSPNGEGYIYIDSYAIKEGYASYKSNISSVSNLSEVVKVIDIKNNELNSNLVEDDLVIQYKNNSSDVLQSITVYALFYSGDKLVYVDYDSEFDISAGNNANLSMYLYDLERNNISYDRYDLIGSAQVNIFND